MGRPLISATNAHPMSLRAKSGDHAFLVSPRTWFQNQFVREPLVMKPRRGNRIFQGEPEFQSIEDNSEHGIDNRPPAGTSRQ